MHKRFTSPRQTIASYAGPRAFLARTRAALRGLGYMLVPAATRGHLDDSSWRPALRVVDERHLDRIPSPTEDPETPIVTLTGPRPLDFEDPRIVGRVQRPAGLVDLYRVFQQALEDHPRRDPRAPTQLPARCIRSDRRWLGALLTLSEGGCLLKSSEQMTPGSRLNLQFALPMGEIVCARASCVHAIGSETGLAFSALATGARERIGDFVTQRLALL